MIKKIDYGEFKFQFYLTEPGEEGDKGYMFWVSARAQQYREVVPLYKEAMRDVLRKHKSDLGCRSFLQVNAQDVVAFELNIVIEENKKDLFRKLLSALLDEMHEEAKKLLKRELLEGELVEGEFLRGKFLD